MALLSFAGIDFGAKTAGTTAWCQLGPKGWVWEQCPKGQDADLWLEQMVQNHSPQALFIDAPLSLPRACIAPTPMGDFAYRSADRQLQAMSPMFLGGLTARAMRLACRFRGQGIPCHEVYPAHCASLLFPKPWYKKGKYRLSDLIAVLSPRLPQPLPSMEQLNEHRFDALLAWFTGYQHQLGNSEWIGDPKEGCVLTIRR